jgi:hypothetical protein
MSVCTPPPQHAKDDEDKNDADQGADHDFTPFDDDARNSRADDAERVSGISAQINDAAMQEWAAVTDGDDDGSTVRRRHPHARPARERTMRGRHWLKRPVAAERAAARVPRRNTALGVNDLHRHEHEGDQTK